MADNEFYRIELDGQWSLLEFERLPHFLIEVYSLHYALYPEAAFLDPDRVHRAFASYPWQGGFSTINFFDALYDEMPSKPKVKSIHYASPGQFILELFIGAAFVVGTAVKIVVKRGGEINRLYNEIQEGVQNRKLGRIKLERERLQLAKEHMEFIEHSLGSLSQALGFKSLEALNSRTGILSDRSKSFCRISDDLKSSAIWPWKARLLSRKTNKRTLSSWMNSICPTFRPALH